MEAASSWRNAARACVAMPLIFSGLWLPLLRGNRLKSGPLLSDPLLKKIRGRPWRKFLPVSLNRISRSYRPEQKAPIIQFLFPFEVDTEENIYNEFNNFRQKLLKNSLNNTTLEISWWKAREWGSNEEKSVNP